MTRPAESCHYYTRAGDACYEVNGKPTTLREARKLSLVPSVTTVLQMVNKPMLTNWLIEQAVLSAMTLPHVEGETLDERALRVEEDRQRQVKQAAARGTAGHAALQTYLDSWFIDLDWAKEISAAKGWFEGRYGLEGWQSEISFAHPMGFGGKTDVRNLTVNAVGDYKFKAFGPEKRPKDLVWFEHVMQLAAYRYGLGMPTADCFNMFLSTTHPGLIAVYEWDEKEILEGWEAYQMYHRLWVIQKKFNPAFVSKEIAA